ncbi:MAG: cytochrome c peroxidase [Rudaea sp.]
MLAVRAGIALMALASCGASFAFISARAESFASMPTPASLGAKIFRDASLSASGQMSCATCHVPENAHAQTNDFSVQSGGINSDVPGFRAVPSLRYLNFNIPFFFAADGTPTGGFDHDGRANDLVAQAERPLLSPQEMANGDAATFAVKLAQASYVEEFKKVYGADVFDDADTAMLAAEFSLSSYELSSSEFHPFDSKFDLFRAGKVMLSPQELRGFAAFNSQQKGGCAGCHPSTSVGGAPPLFTDYTYDNIGVPRNMELAANADPAYFDMGLCGPERTDLVNAIDLCGQFKVPTLRNVATRHVIFHNGAFHDLRKAIEFYVQRDTNPEKWYPLDANGVVQKFSDIPPLLARNVNQSEVPYNRHPGQDPALSEDEIDDVMAFLKTLTDGYDSTTDTADPARDVASFD